MKNFGFDFTIGSEPPYSVEFIFQRFLAFLAISSQNTPTHFTALKKPSKA
jgi:hypothetical protein